MRKLIALALVVPALLSACTSPEPLAGIDLPPAALPEVLESGGWAVSFTRDLEPGFWAEGSHLYMFGLACEPLGEPFSTEPIFLEATPMQEVFDETIYVRLVGLSHLVLGPKTLNSINPEQPTKAVITSLGASKEAAQEAYESCLGALRVDGGDPIALVPEPPFTP